MLADPQFFAALQGVTSGVVEKKIVQFQYASFVIPTLLALTVRVAASSKMQYLWLKQ
jgi:hypothetical protein